MYSTEVIRAKYILLFFFLICTEQKPIKLKVGLKSANFTRKESKINRITVTFTEKSVNYTEKRVKFTDKNV